MSYQKYISMLNFLRLRGYNFLRLRGYYLLQNYSIKSERRVRSFKIEMWRRGCTPTEGGGGVRLQRGGVRLEKGGEVFFPNRKTTTFMLW